MELQNLDEAHQKIEEERVMIDENQFLRYKRAMGMLSSQGLTVDKKLIARKY